MNLYLVRHGEAADEKTDPARPLTEKGREEIARAAASLKKSGARIDEIWHSGKLRARQTAQIIGDPLGIGSVIEKEGLKPNDPVAPIAELIDRSEKNILIAGHLPFLGKLAALLLTGSEEREVVRFKSAGLVVLEKSDSSWKLRWTRRNQLVALVLIFITLLFIIGAVIGIW